MKLATPPLRGTVAVPELKVPWGLPDLMDMATEPLAELTTLLKLSSTETATLGMALPAVPGPGVAGVKATLNAEAA